MYNKLTRNCYHVMREVVERPRRRLVTLFYYLDLAIATYGIRFYALALIAYADFPKIPYLNWRHDPICFFLYRHKKVYDAFIPVVIFLLEVFHIFVKYRLFNLRDLDCTVWRWWYEMIVVNQDAYYDNLLSNQEVEAVYASKESVLLNRWAEEDSFLVKLSVPDFGLKVLGKVFARWDTFRNLDYVDKKRLFAYKLAVLPNLSDHLRVKMLFISIFADKIIGAVQIMQIVLAILLVLIFLPQMVSLYSPGYKLVASCWFAFDATVATYQLLGLYQSALFFAYCTVLTYTVHAGHVIDLYKRVSNILFGRKRNSSGAALLTAKDYLGFRNFLIDQTLASYLFSAGGVKLFSAVMWAFLVTNTPINIYCIRRLVFIEQPLFVDVIIWFIFLLQFSACCVVMGPLARSCQVLHRPTGWIARFQLMTTNFGAHRETHLQLSWTLLKFKFNDLFFRLLYGPKCAICIGPTSPITYMTAVEYVMMYGGYLLMVFSQMIESQSSVGS